MGHRTFVCLLLIGACGKAPHPATPLEVPPEPDAAAPAPARDARLVDPPPAPGADASATSPDTRVMEGPAPDAATADAPPPATGCKFALCEGFETYADGQVPDPALWAQKATKATVDGVHTRRGSKALHVPPVMHDSVYIRETRTFPALSKAFYARLYLWVDKEPIEKPPNLYHWTLIESAAREDGTGPAVRLGGHIEARFPGDWLRFNYESHAPTDPHETGLSDKGALIAPRIWNCIEVYFDMDRQEARIWLNGMERPMLHWLNNMPDKPMFQFPPEIHALSFGWTEYQTTQTPFEVWLDEIAVDGKRIGCDD